MPELPEVETIKRTISQAVIGPQIINANIYRANLRWQIPKDFAKTIIYQTITSVTRRGKYLLLNMANGSIIIHFGMTGKLSFLKQCSEIQKHDHLDILFRNGCCLRFTDPRRFGSVLFATNPLEHKLLKDLGVEPLTKEFTANYLFEKAQRRSIPIKQFLMDHHVVVGIGNIYASEALFMARINPLSKSMSISKLKFKILVSVIKKILKNAIAKSGTTFRDFVDSNGTPGEFKSCLNVYGREGKPCPKCHSKIIKISQGQRSTFYCSKCQIKS